MWRCNPFRIYTITVIKTDILYQQKSNSVVICHFCVFSDFSDLINFSRYNRKYLLKLNQFKIFEIQ